MFKKDILPFFFLGAFLIAIVLYLTTQPKSGQKETFLNPTDDSDLKVQACPQDTTSIQTKN